MCRFYPELKQALSIITERDGRSVVNFMEWLICKPYRSESVTTRRMSDAEQLSSLQIGQLFLLMANSFGQR